MDESGKVLESGKPRETREFNGKTYLMETALTGDVAILRAWKADEAGNCVFRYVFQYFNNSFGSLTLADIPPRHSGRSWPRPRL
jgi:acyl CoA:acetate/3-ketoacid CoA transferase alpha subunit